MLTMIVAEECTPKLRIGLVVVVSPTIEIVKEEAKARLLVYVSCKVGTYAVLPVLSCTT